MDDFRARVSRLQRAAWALRAASPRPCALPFALAMMTDERRHPDLVSIIERLPPGPPVLIVFRHYGLAADARAALACRALAAARAGGHPFVVADGGLAGDGAHNAGGHGTGRLRAGHTGLRTASVHTLGEGAGKRRALRPHLALVSPVLPTASHPGAPALGPVRADAVARRLAVPAFALGGMDEGSARRLRGTAFTGIAALGAFSLR